MKTSQPIFRQSAASARVARLALCAATLTAFAGCATYVVESPPPAVVAPPPVMVAAAPAEGVVEIRAVDDFYEPLSPYGEWVVVGAYGRCWRPSRMEAGWRPYGDGYWQRTDAGWYWVSPEPWAWATYHYGRWDWTPQFGWVWVPQTQWAPAWVAWREGAGYVGWAPLPPSATIVAGGAVVFNDAGFALRAFVFVPERRLLEPVRPTTVIVNNTTVINQTINITRIKVVNRTVFNDGPRPDTIERASGQRIQPVAFRELRHREETEFVARRRNAPSNPAHAMVLPPRPGGEPVKAVPPHQPLRVEQTAGRPVASRPLAPGNAAVDNPREYRQVVAAPRPESRTPPPRPNDAVERKPAQIQMQPTREKSAPRQVTGPVASRSESRPSPGRAEAAAPERRPAPTEIQSGTRRPGPANETRLQQANKPADRQLRSPKDKPATRPSAGSSARQNEQAQKRERPESEEQPAARH
jgi:hypothetical protein